MPTLQELQEQLQNALNEMESKRQSGLDISSNEATIAILKHQIMEAESQQERIQEQEAEVESITLPYDYNDILGNPIANETIIELLRQSKRQAQEDRNMLVDEMNAGWKQRLDELTNEWYAAKANLHNMLGDLQTKLDAETEQAELDAIEIIELSQQVAQLGLEKHDAELKRDAAVRELGEENGLKELNLSLLKENADLQAQIEALKQELTAKKSLTVNSNDKLAELAAKAKESTVSQIDRNLKRWNDQYGIDIPTLEVPELEPVNPVTEQEAPAEEQPFPIEEEVRSAAFGLVEESLQVLGEGIEEESEVDVKAEQIAFLQSFVNDLNSRHIDLSMRVYNLESKQAVA